MDEWEPRIRDSSVVPERLGPTMKIGAVMGASLRPDLGLPGAAVLTGNTRREAEVQRTRVSAFPCLLESASELRGVT
jgi:hypothetical protein